MKDHIIFQLRGEISQLKDTISQLQAKITENNAIICALRSALLEHRHCPIILHQERDEQMAPYLSFLASDSSSVQARPRELNTRPASAASGVFNAQVEKDNSSISHPVVNEKGDCTKDVAIVSNKRLIHESDLNAADKRDVPTNNPIVDEIRCSPENGRNVSVERDNQVYDPNDFRNGDLSENIPKSFEITTYSENNATLENEYPGNGNKGEVENIDSILSVEHDDVIMLSDEEMQSEQMEIGNERSKCEQDVVNRNLLHVVEDDNLNMTPVNSKGNTSGTELQSITQTIESLHEVREDNNGMTSAIEVDENEMIADSLEPTSSFEVQLKSNESERIYDGDSDINDMTPVNFIDTETVDLEPTVCAQSQSKSKRRGPLFVDEGYNEMSTVNFEDTPSTEMPVESKENDLSFEEVDDNDEMTSVHFEHISVGKSQSKSKRSDFLSLENDSCETSGTELQSNSQEINAQNTLSIRTDDHNEHALEKSIKSRLRNTHKSARQQIESHSENSCRTRAEDSIDTNNSSKKNGDLKKNDEPTTSHVKKPKYSAAKSILKPIVKDLKQKQKRSSNPSQTVLGINGEVPLGAGNSGDEKQFCAQKNDPSEQQTRETNQKTMDDLLRCEMCSKTYISRHRLLEHEREKHFRYFIKCFFCEYKNRRLKYLESHIYLCKGLKCHIASFEKMGKTIPCFLCDSVFHSDTDIFQHTTTHLKAISIPKPTIAFEAPYECPVCEQEFDDLDGIKQHLGSSHKEDSGPFECKICSEKVKTANKLLNHIGALHIEREQYPRTKLTPHDPYSCPICDEKFTFLLDIQQHIKYHEDVEKNLRCKICGLKKPKVIRLFQHMEKEHIDRGLPKGQNAKRFKCSQCEMAFSKAYRLEKHLQVHEFGEATCTIGSCKRTFKSPYHLERHKERVHFGKLKCDDCDRCFKNPSDLKNHRIRKHEERKFQCDHCSAMFSFENKMHLHIKHVHTNERPFKCTKCDRTYKRRSQLRMHDESVHRAKKFQCSKCAKTFSTLKGLENHEAWHSNIKPIKCPYCPKSFATTLLLNAHKNAVHVNVRKFTCDQCGDSFKVKHHLKAHMLKHTGALDFKCDYCGKAFMRKQILDTHILSHTGQRPFSCSRCFKSFIRKTDLNKHWKEKHGTERDSK